MGATLYEMVQRSQTASDSHNAVLQESVDKVLYSVVFPYICPADDVACTSSEALHGIDHGPIQSSDHPSHIGDDPSPINRSIQPEKQKQRKELALDKDVVVVLKKPPKNANTCVTHLIYRVDRFEKTQVIAWTASLAHRYPIHFGIPIFQKCIHNIASLIFPVLLPGNSDVTSPPILKADQAYFEMVNAVDLLNTHGTTWSESLTHGSTIESVLFSLNVIASTMTTLVSSPLTLENILDISPESGTSTSGLEQDKNAVSLTKIFLLALLLLSSTESALRSYVGNTMLPLISKWVLHYHGAKSAALWATVSWRQIQLMCTSLPRSHPFHVEIAGYLCRLFDHWMGLEKTLSGAYIFTRENILIDLRYEEMPFRIIQAGLCSHDSTELKYSQFLLKRFVYFSESYRTECNATDGTHQWTSFFSWPPSVGGRAGAASTKLVVKMWEEFFMLFDTVQEPYVHLIEPLIPKIANLLDQKNVSHTLGTKLHPSWWIVLVHRGIHNHSHPIRKRMLDVVISVSQPNLLEILAADLDFTAGTLLSQVDEPSQFAVPGLGIFISPFGEKLSQFVVNIALSIKTRSESHKFISRMIQSMQTFNTRLGVIFVLQGLALLGTRTESPDTARCLTSVDINALISLIVGERSVSVYKNLKTRDLICSFGLVILERLVDPSQTSFDVVARAIAELSHESTWFDMSSMEYNSIRKWLIESFPSDYMVNTLHSRLREYLQPCSDTHTRDTQPVVADHNMENGNECRNLATLAHYLIKRGNNPEEISPSVYSATVVLAPLHEILERLGGPYLAEQVTYRVLSFMCLLVQFHRCVSNSSNLGGRVIVSCNTVSLRDDCIYSATLPTVCCTRISEYIKRELRLATHPSVYVDTLAVVLEDVATALCVNLQGMSVRAQWETEKHDLRLYLTSIWNQGADTLEGLYSFYSCLRLYSTCLRVLSCVAPVPGDYIFDEDVTLALLILQSDPIGSIAHSFSSSSDTYRKTKAKFTALRYAVVYDIINAITIKSQSSANADIGLVCDAALANLFKTVVDALDGALVSSCCSLMQLACRVLDLQPTCVDNVLICKAITASMCILKENWSHSKWWPRLMQAYVDLVFHPNVLSNKEFMHPESIISEHFALMIKWGASRVGVMNFVASKLHAFWLRAVDFPLLDDSTIAASSLESMHINMDWVVDMILYGPLRDSDTLDLKHEAMIALKLVENSLSDDTVSELKGTASWNFSSRDYVVRVQINDILMRLRYDCSSYAQFSKELLARLVKIQVESAYTNQFVNTSAQRCQLRAWISIHVLLGVISQEDEALTYLNAFVESIVIEQLAETRSYIEWATARLMIAFPALHAQFWKHLTNSDYRAHVVSSLLTILLHVGEHLAESSQVKFFRDAILAIIPWATSNHFNMRLFAHYGLFKFWNFCLEKPYLQCVVDEMSNVQALMQFIITNPECSRHRVKCTSYYFVGGGFHPLKDVNIEFLFRGGPTVLHLADDEKISAMAFLRVNPKAGYSMPTGYNQREMIRSLVASSIKLTSKSLDLGKLDISDSATTTPAKSLTVGDDIQEAKTNLEVDFDKSLQKKILSWETLMHTNMDLSTEREAQVLRVRNPLIVVASLISKAPNLGGLCRTCEIFNAELLVVNNIKIKEDPIFSNTSVSADRWMPMQEVREEHLESYLVQMKGCGYAIVGVEQATRSVSLDSFSFPEKTVILLGKEREGIPAHLMGQLDHVLEIPQFGVIRSLNVHVSGALIVWEYTKQHIRDI
ncbi:hypothetical protein BASA61_006589 [Batrachochytrium salamandrivorans]|nr:hypothetical protein BASA61_006589 [Batrachochytrium salamandrivorans]